MSHSTGNMNNRQTGENGERKKGTPCGGRDLAEHRLLHHAHG